MTRRNQMARLTAYITYAAKRLRTDPLYQFAGAVWLAFALLILLFYLGISPKGTCYVSHYVTILSSATILTMPLFLCRPRMRWTLWTVLACLTLFVLINLLYYHHFAIPLPLSSIYLLKNVDLMVLQATFDSFNLFISLSLLPLSTLAIAWWAYFRRRIKGKCYSRRGARAGITAGAALWCLMQICSSAIYIRETHSNASADGHDAPNLLTCATEKYRGKVMTHTEYLYHNGLEFYLIWALGDFSPAISLNSDDLTEINSFIAHQDALHASHPIVFEKDSTARTSTPNLLIIMVESFETWPLEYKIEGRPCLQYMDSLIKRPGTLYFPRIVSQAASGRSSDGHLLCLTGLLPLRDSPTVMHFYNNSYPSIIKAYKQKYGGHAFEIISDEPKMWNQDSTFKRYGFDTLYDVTDMDPDHVSNWLTRDSYWGSFTATQLSKQPVPFACMTVSLSLHSPYLSKVKGYDDLNALDLPQQSIHYLKVCKKDEQYIKWMINSLRQRGIFDNTVIVITGDHMAVGLKDKERPASLRGKEKFLPLIILNSGYKNSTYPYMAGQVDIYPTLLDILGLQDYQWRGLGLSLLRFTHDGATRSDLERVGNHTPEEADRQHKAWDISNLLIRSNHLQTN